MARGALRQSLQGSELMATKTASPLLPTLFISGDRNGCVADQIVAPSAVDTTASSPSHNKTSDVPLISWGSPGGGCAARQRSLPEDNS